LKFTKAKSVLFLLTVTLLPAIPLSNATAQSNSLILGYSGTGISSDLRRVMEIEKIWEKNGLNVKSIYFNSGSILTQAMLGGNIVVSDSGVPEMMTLPVSGAMETKVITVNINRLEHIFATRKNISKPEDLKGKRIAVSRFGSASDLTTRMVLRSWKLDPEKEVVLLQSGNTPTRMSALLAGHVDGALVSPEGIHKVLASFCRKTAKKLHDAIWASRWEMILSLLSRKWVAKESGGVRWSTEWSREKTLRPGVSREGVTAGHWATPLVGGVFAFGSIGERWS
jgi:ABC-type nitrate/sulfonate/bicarbonate transport system substrate-binding protein